MNDGRLLLCEVQEEAGNPGRERSDHEEWSQSDEGEVSEVQYWYVPDSREVKTRAVFFGYGFASALAWQLGDS